MQPISKDFLNRSAIKVARDLIGCYLVISNKGNVEKFMITETEAYEGLTDLASHASKGITKRTEIMFRESGHIYVYLVYGMYWMFNIVTGKKGHPSAVLIRGITGAKGPGKLTRLLGITNKLNGKMLGKESGIWLEKEENKNVKIKIKCGPRIGVSYAGPIWSNKKWRFYVNED